MSSRNYESTTRHPVGHPVVVVHGLWLNGFETFLLRERLSVAGFAPASFSYPSTRASLEEVTDALAQRLRSFDGPVHLVAHSLGGVVVLETLVRECDLPPGRVVLLGSPVQGSRAACAVASWSLGAHILGPLAFKELARTRNCTWAASRELGVIAGIRSVGLGRMIAELPSPNDGTVSLDETRIDGATEQIAIDVSHTGMLVSSQVASAVVRFLGRGSFGRLER